MKQIEKHHRMPDGVLVLCDGSPSGTRVYEDSQWNRVIAPIQEDPEKKTLGRSLRNAEQKHLRLLRKYGDHNAIRADRQRSPRDR